MNRERVYCVVVITLIRILSIIYLCDSSIWSSTMATVDLQVCISIYIYVLRKVTYVPHLRIREKYTNRRFYLCLIVMVNILSTPFDPTSLPRIRAMTIISLMQETKNPPLPLFHSLPLTIASRYVLYLVVLFGCSSVGIGRALELGSVRHFAHLGRKYSRKNDACRGEYYLSFLRLKKFFVRFFLSFLSALLQGR